MERTERAHPTKTAAVKPMLVLRADAAPGMGTGHVMRCIALGQAWLARGGEAILITGDLISGLEARILTAGIAHEALTVDTASSEDAAAVVGHASTAQALAIAVDGYHFPASYHEALQAAGIPVVLVDDHGRTGSTAADMILDQNLGASAANYDAPDTCQLLRGPAFAVLRPEFGRPRSAASTPPRRLLITLGGDAPLAAWETMIAAAAALPGLEATAIVGTGQQERGTIVQRLQRSAVEVRENVMSMAELIDANDLVLMAGGSTVLEVVARRRPFVCFPIAENQIPVAHAIDREGLGVAVDPGATTADLVTALLRLVQDHELRRSIKAAQDRADPGGAGRVVAAIKALGIHIRPVTLADAKPIWHWANDVATRAASFHPGSIPWSEHEAWLQTRINDPVSLLFIAMHRDQELGFVWFRKDRDHAVISVNIAPPSRGQGWGAAVVRAGTLRCAQHWECPVHAYIRAANHASIHTFANAGYIAARAVEHDGQPAVRMQYFPGSERP